MEQCSYPKCSGGPHLPSKLSGQCLCFNGPKSDYFVFKKTELKIIARLKLNKVLETKCKANTLTKLTVAHLWNLLQPFSFSCSSVETSTTNSLLFRHYLGGGSFSAVRLTW